MQGIDCYPDPPLSVSDMVEGGDGRKKATSLPYLCRAYLIYVEPCRALLWEDNACPLCPPVPPCAPRACHNSGEPCRILVEGCCALLLGGLPASLPRHILVKPRLFLVKPRLFPHQNPPYPGQTPPFPGRSPPFPG